MNSSKKIILTGATGLIGKEVLPLLKKEGFEVLALSSKTCNLFNKNEIDSVFKAFRPAYLLNFAWCTTGDYLNSELNYKFLEAGMNMLSAFKQNGGRRAVFAGTCFEYKFKDAPLKENDELNPLTIYAKCKVELFKQATEYCIQNGISFGWGRIFYVYGENENEKRLTPYLINNLKNNKTTEIKCGQLIKDYMYTKDIAGAFVKFIKTDVEGPVNICTGEGISLKDFGKAIAAKLNKVEYLEIRNERTTQPPIITGDNTKLKNCVQYNIKYSLSSALDEILY